PKTQHPAQQNTEPRPQHPEKQNPDHSTPKSRTQTTAPRTPQPAPRTTEHRTPNTGNNPQSSQSSSRPEVFLGTDPYKQRDLVFSYFEKKPKAKELLKSNPQQFKELLSQRDDVKPIFENVNIDKLSEKLNAVEGGANE
ncbi:MAG: hypothetical protein ACQESC_02300, partial [Nanobdellota archaeon]